MNELIEILYLLFGVNKDDGISKIKSSYRNLAKKFHTDKNDIDPNIFIAITKGYEILIKDINKETPSKKSNNKKKDSPPVDLNEQDINYLAVKKLKNTFKLLLSQNSAQTLLNLNVNQHIIQLFNNDSNHYKEANAHIRNEKDVLIKFKKRVRVKNDIAFFIDMIDNEIEENKQKIIENKNKIKINESAIEILKEYTFEDFMFDQEI